MHGLDGSNGREEAVQTEREELKQRKPELGLLFRSGIMHPSSTEITLFSNYNTDLD